MASRPEHQRAHSGIKAGIWSCPSPRKAYVPELLEGRQGPAITATDYIRLQPKQIRQFVPMRYKVLGTDENGRNDTRENLRRHFEVDRYYVAQAAVAALVPEGKLPTENGLKSLAYTRKLMPTTLLFADLS